MGKPLTEMTKEELFALFPIVFVPHNELWEGFCRDMKREKTSDLGKRKRQSAAKVRASPPFGALFCSKSPRVPHYPAAFYAVP